MIDHHIQKHIVAKLALVESAHFTELRPKHIDSNAFTYHIKQLIRDKLVEKKDRVYTLTPDGRRLGIEAKNNQLLELAKAYSVIFVALRNDQGEWLLRKRLHHPLIGKIGFIHVVPISSMGLVQNSQADLFKQTGIRARLRTCGSGFINTYKKEGLESYLNFTVVTGNVASNELPKKADDLSEYAWYKEADLAKLPLVPSLQDVIQLIEKTKPKSHFFAELKYDIS